MPGTDLARSAAFYRDLLALTYAREFGDGATVTGCALADFDAGYMLALRRRDTTAGHADLRGEHPIIVGVPARDTLSPEYDSLTAQRFHPAPHRGTFTVRPAGAGRRTRPA